jgi:hypothetical protein
MTTTTIDTINDVLYDLGCDSDSYLDSGLTATADGANGVILSDDSDDYRYDDASRVLAVLADLGGNVTPNDIIVALG